MKRIGVFGGTFDPVHNGHVELARQAIKECELDELIVVPVNEQPLKLDRKLASNIHRLKMLDLAFADEKRITISDIEMEKGDVSYTIDTLREIKHAYENAEVWFVVGIDAFLKVEIWKDADELLKEFPFIIGTRPGYNENEQKEFIDYLREKFGTTIKTVDNAQIPVSSTGIKNLIKMGKTYDEIVPPDVARYIFENGLYVKHLKNKHPKFRKDHMMGVWKVARLLARHYGVDEDKAATAAYYHDFYKKITPKELQTYAERFNLDEKYKDNINLAHSKIAAEMMKLEHGILDEDIINAVKFHTTGRAGMSTLEKIIFIADVIEPSRDYAGVEYLRELAYVDLDRACLITMYETVERLSWKRAFIDEDTIQAIEWLKSG